MRLRLFSVVQRPNSTHINRVSFFPEKWIKKNYHAFTTIISLSVIGTTTKIMLYIILLFLLGGIRLRLFELNRPVSGVSNSSRASTVHCGFITRLSLLLLLLLPKKEKEKWNVQQLFFCQNIIFFFIFHFQILYYLAYFFVHNLLHNKSKKLTVAMKWYDWPGVVRLCHNKKGALVLTKKKSIIYNIYKYNYYIYIIYKQKYINLSTLCWVIPTRY